MLGIAVGVALLFASQVASTSLDGSVQRLTADIVGHMQFQLEARGPQGLDQALLGRIQRMRGVRSTLPVLEQQANIIGPMGQAAVDLLGVEPRLARAGGPLLRHFSYEQIAKQKVLVLPAPVARSIGAGPLQPATLQVGSYRIPTLIGATLQEEDIGSLVHSQIAAAPIVYAQELAGLRGRYTRIMVQAAPAQEHVVHTQLQRLANAMNVNLEPADFVSRLFQVAAAPTNQGTSLFSAISALVGFLFAFNAMLVTAHLRRTLIENLRRWGATRLMAVEVLFVDALVLGALGVLFGLALGDLLSIAVFHATPGYLSFAFPVGSVRIITWQSVGLAAGAGLLAACVGVLAPLMGILRRPLRTVKGATHSTSRWRRGSLIAGLCCLAATTAILLYDDVNVVAAVAALACLVGGLLFLLPMLFEATITVFEGLQYHLYSASTLLAVTELRAPANRTRSLAIAGTGAIAVFGSVAIGGASANLQSGLDESARAIDTNAAVWVTPAGRTNAFATTPFIDVASQRLRKLPGVRSVDIYRGGFLNWGERRVWVLGFPRVAEQPIPTTHLIAGDLGLATAHIRGHGWAVVSQALASEYNLKVGMPFTLPSPRPSTFRVAAVSSNLGWPPGAIIINADDYARAWNSSDPSAYQIQTTAGFSAMALRREIQLVLGRHTGLAVETSSQREQRHYAQAHQGLAQLTQLRILMMIAAVLAMGGAMGSMIWQRRPLLAYIKRQGYKRGVLWRALFCESALLLGAGCSIGAIFGLYGELLQSHALASVTGFPVVFSVGIAIAILSFAIVSLTAVLVVALPGYLAVRVRPTTISPA